MTGHAWWICILRESVPTPALFRGPLLSFQGVHCRLSAGPKSWLADEEAWIWYMWRCGWGGKPGTSFHWETDAGQERIKHSESSSPEDVDKESTIAAFIPPWKKIEKNRNLRLKPMVHLSERAYPFLQFHSFRPHFFLAVLWLQKLIWWLQLTYLICPLHYNVLVLRLPVSQPEILFLEV